jgi:hypothetical protein
MEFTGDILDIARVMYFNNMTEFKEMINSFEFNVAATALNPFYDKDVSSRYENYTLDVFWIVNSFIFDYDGQLNLNSLLVQIMSIDDTLSYLPWNIAQVLSHFTTTNNGFVVSCATE